MYEPNLTGSNIIILIKSGCPAVVNKISSSNPQVLFRLIRKSENDFTLDIQTVRNLFDKKELSANATR